jgi:hypothetical protein
MLVSSEYQYNQKIDEATITLKVKGISAIFENETEKQVEQLSYTMHAHLTEEIMTNPNYEEEAL